MGREQRKSPRRLVAASGMIVSADGKKPIANCSVRDVSATGAQIILERETDLPKKFLLVLSHQGKVRRVCTVVWQFSIMAGVSFAPPPDAAA